VAAIIKTNAVFTKELLLAGNAEKSLYHAIRSEGPRKPARVRA